MSTMVRTWWVMAILAGLVAAGALLAEPALAAFRDDIVRDLGGKTATLVAPIGQEWLIDLDATDGIQVGDLFAVVTRGAPVVHPLSKKVIGTLDETHAVLRVSRLKSAYSYVAVISSSGELKAGEQARRFAGLPAVFRDYTGGGEELFTWLQAVLPQLQWQSYAAVPAQFPEPPLPAAGMAPGLIFELNTLGLVVRDHQLQQLRSYPTARLSLEPPPAIARAVLPAPPPAAAVEAPYPGPAPASAGGGAAAAGILAASPATGRGGERSAPRVPDQAGSIETGAGVLAGGAPPAPVGTGPVPADAAAPPTLLPPADAGEAEPAVTAAPSVTLPLEPAPPAAPGVPAPASGSEGVPVSLVADQVDYDGAAGVFLASGDVLLEQGGVRLAADQVLWQDSTRDAVAAGQVRLTDPGGELAGSSLHANFTTGLGRVEDGRVFMRERNFHLAGAEIERLGEATYRVADGRFTTCDGEVPDWQFTAGQVDVTLGGYAVARDVWFEVRDWPLLYLPYLVFPVKAERESGFLTPRFGYSSRKGALLSLAWYQVIDRHLDATVYLDYLSRLGLGKGLEYRYALGDDNLGEARYYHVSGFDDTPDSYALAWRHGGTLPGAVRLTADVEYVNRREFFEDFGEAAEEYNRNFTVSTVMAQRNWRKLNLTGYARYLKDLDNDNDATLQTLPELGLTVPHYRLDDGPLYSRTELIATRYARDEGEDGERLFLRQGLGMVLKPGNWLEFNPEVAVYGRYYHLDAGEENDLVPEYAATLSSRLLRTFPFGRWGIERLQHSIEPQVRYVYVPHSEQDDLPDFVPSDRIGPLNQVEYALVNRLTARSTGADGAAVYRELLNLRLSQAYDVRDDNEDDVGPFSDLRAELRLRPAEKSFFELDALTKVHGDLQFTRFSAGGGFDDSHGNLARLVYFYRNANAPAQLPEAYHRIGAFSDEPVDYLEAELATARFAPFYLNVAERYDFVEGTSLETVLGVEYRARCWSLFVTLRDRPDSEEILVGFALSGLGRVGGFGSTLRPPVE